MTVRIDVVATIPDARAQLKIKDFRAIAGPHVQTVSVVDSYLIDASLSPRELSLARRALTNSRVEASHAGRWLPKKFNFAIEIGFLPGVTDNVGTTAQEAIEDATKKKFSENERVYSAQVFFIEGAISRGQAEHIAATLYNPLIQSAKISGTELRNNPRAEPSVPRVVLSGSSRVLSVNLDVDDAELEMIGKAGISDERGVRRGPLALDLPSMHAIKNHFRYAGRAPTDAELEMLAQTWSEHCKHTIFASAIDGITDGLYKTYIKGATATIRKKKGKKDFCVSVFKDNAGGIIFDDDYVITHKVETHNTPSALDPFGGAITGIVGVNRDTLGFGLGAKPVANVYGFCFAPAEDERRLYRDREKTQEMLSARRIAEGVIAGINAGGNQSGIPTSHGFMIFDESYRGKPLVFAGTVGLIPQKSGSRKLYEKKALSGDYVVMVGGMVGVDGIHGATFSSESLASGSPATAVQIGDPITQKKFSDALVKEARDKNLYNSITDNGAGGLSSSVGEMARESSGVRVELEKVPLKYPGLEPWQIWISESQERMTVAVPKSKWREFSELMKRRDVEATIIGEFTNTGRCVVSYKNSPVVDIDLEFLHNGLPKKHLETSEFKVESLESRVQDRTEQKDYSETIFKMLGQSNIASNEFISRQYDHEVQGGSVIKPLQGSGRVNGDASVFKPVLSSRKAVVLSSGIAPYYSNIDPYKMAAVTVDTAVRNAIVAGANLDHLALLDNFCWCSSDEPERLWQLKEAARACHDYAVLYGTPFISGKDSMFNDFKGYDENGEFIKISALPTLLISSLGVIADAEKTISIDPKSVGDIVYVLGETHDEMAGSEYYRMQNLAGGAVPTVDAKKNLKTYRAFAKAVEQELVASAISVGRGGLAVALSKMAMAGTCGAEINISKLPGTMIYHSASTVLFSESQGRILMTVAPGHAKGFEKLLNGVAFTKIGTITKAQTLSIKTGKKKVGTLGLEKALSAYRSRFKNW
ncbi:phosphoribosylformylglycinamidine synthase II [Candidatus Kaiserbacteria bacterium RIFCSPHIGHO2_01_FULL_48_10]|uniref:Phosphoribosylformylglycinamidine synthase subunit PurL n=1 Tax=Candidatus Kaiserbacteria bacterium RIFCSPHIGHO2_01_FULL_48_10 TaxID=1798476 RepID=A0A1F6C2V0_9BACT|nr:MAG: phosphoribosylformylglycinamidine synthase II [Candidatus Kaiserbacteria bacterium RIFCSPHIGHO2_01_FULL_48_10]